MWQQELHKLRMIALNYKLTEEVKWGKPCYSFEGKNLLILIGFKSYCAILFFKGSLMADPRTLLVKPGEHSEIGRQMRFTSHQEIDSLEMAIGDYIQEAIRVEKSGEKVQKRNPSDLQLPAELVQKFEEIPSLKGAFALLTPGRQREYCIHFSQPKQQKTREARVEKCIPNILAKRGLTDRS